MKTLTRCYPSVCKDRSIPRLVYTSTINAVFTGKPIVECDEDSVPYVPADVVSKYLCPVHPRIANSKPQRFATNKTHLSPGRLIKCDLSVCCSTSTITPEPKRLQSRWSSLPTVAPWKVWKHSGCASTRHNHSIIGKKGGVGRDYKPSVVFLTAPAIRAETVDVTLLLFFIKMGFKFLYVPYIDRWKASFNVTIYLVTSHHIIHSIKLRAESCLFTFSRATSKCLSPEDVFSVLLKELVV